MLLWRWRPPGRAAWRSDHANNAFRCRVRSEGAWPGASAALLRTAAMASKTKEGYLVRIPLTLGLYVPVVTAIAAAPAVAAPPGAPLPPECSACTARHPRTCSDAANVGARPDEKVAGHAQDVAAALVRAGRWRGHVLQEPC